MATVDRSKKYKIFLFAFSLLLLITTLTGCKPPAIRERAFGYFRLGQLKDLTAPRTYFPEYGLVLIRDEKGFAVMSTLCTHDLTPLSRETTPEGETWRSKETTSRYSSDGKVLEGPAVGDLPYYQLELEAWEYGGPKNTLYAKVGREKPREWRLSVPQSP